MPNIPYGMSVLFETMAHNQQIDTEMEEITSAMLCEGMTYDDAVDAGIMSEDEVEQDQDVYDEVDIDDEKLASLCDKIDPIDDNMDEAISGLDEALEAFLDENYL